MTEAKRGNVSYNLDLLLQSAAMVVKKLLIDEKKNSLCFPVIRLVNFVRVALVSVVTFYIGFNCTSVFV